MKSIGMADQYSDGDESLQFILNGTEREIAFPHDLPDISRPPLVTKEQSKNFSSSFRKQDLQN
jgi:hypothetical protein